MSIKIYKIILSGDHVKLHPPPMSDIYKFVFVSS